MEKAQGAATDQGTEQFLGYLLRAGVLLASAIVLVGGMFYLRRHGSDLPDYHTFRGEPSTLRSIPAILRGAWSLDERSLMQLGILLLIATPVMRVACSVWIFFEQHDFVYVAVTLIVLALLFYGLLGVS